MLPGRGCQPATRCREKSTTLPFVSNAATGKASDLRPSADDHDGACSASIRLLGGSRLSRQEAACLKRGSSTDGRDAQADVLSLLGNDGNAPLASRPVRVVGRHDGNHTRRADDSLAPCGECDSLQGLRLAGCLKMVTGNPRLPSSEIAREPRRTPFPGIEGLRFPGIE